MTSFSLLLGGLRANAQILDLVATSDGGLAALFLNRSLVGPDDSEIERLCLAFFRPDAAGELKADGRPKVIEVEKPSDINLSAGIAATDDGGILYLSRRLTGEETPVSRFTSRLFNDEGRQVASNSQKIDGRIAPSVFLAAAAPDEDAQPTVVMSGTGELFGFNARSGRMLALNQSVSTEARALALDDGTLLVTPSVFDPGNFVSGFSLESLAGTGSDVSFDFLNVSSPFVPTFAASGNTAAALIVSGGLLLAVARPGAGAAAEAALDLLPGADRLSAAGAVEIAGVGYAVVAASSLSGEAQVQVVDFDGDVIASAIFPGAVSGVGSDLQVVALARPPGEGMRLLLASIGTQNTADGTRDVSTAATVDLRPAIDVTGTSLDDFLTGYDKDDVIRGEAGDDRIFGHGGDDFLFGDDGDDRLEGGAGEDLMAGLDGKDRLEGGEGADHLDGGEGRDRLLGDGGRDALFGGAGADRLEGGGGEDRLAGGAGGDELEGGGARDRLDGGSGDDELEGGAARDLLVGGEGSDILRGGKGGDRFVFLAVEDSGAADDLDVIVDFSRRQGDRIDLSAIDARTNTGRDDAFKFIGEADFSERAGQLRLRTLRDEAAIVQADVDGDGRADLVFAVQVGGGALKAADFLL